MWYWLAAGAALIAAPEAASGSAAQPSQSADPAALIQRAQEVLGWTRIGHRVLHSHAVWAEQHNYESDRYYPPFFDRFDAVETWFEARYGVQRVAAHATLPGFDLPETTRWFDSRAGAFLAGDRAEPVPRSLLRTRNLDPWAVIYDWSRATDVRLAGREVYREYPRIVLARDAPGGPQKLFLDPKTGFPVKLDYIEPHYLWGQRHIEYVYSNWTRAGAIQISASAARLADGAVEISATTSSAELIEIGKSPCLKMPRITTPADDLPVFLRPQAPEVLSIGPATFLLINPGYIEAVTLAGDQLYLFDATQGEQRARLDSEAIDKLFPGRHRINVVVTDLAWPHVAGLRYWVAHGATIISHKAARPFLQAVVDRRWTLKPDLLEQRRTSARFRFVGIEDVTRTPDGQLTLVPIDGIGSEIALAAYIAADQFLWASDYIQTLDHWTGYTADVWNAVQRAHLQPRQVAAQHVGLTAWAIVEGLKPADGE